jgi:hypothetical protein
MAPPENGLSGKNIVLSEALWLSENAALTANAGNSKFGENTYVGIRPDISK